MNTMHCSRRVLFSAISSGPGMLNSGHRWLMGLWVAVWLGTGLTQAQDRWNPDGGRDRFGTGSQAWPGGSWMQGPGGNQEWTLGVRGDSTDTGFMVRQVTTSGAADRARIQAGDTIIAVEGYQVGMVSGRLYDLTQEINRRADASGAVRLLLQDGQTGRLATVRVQLDDHSHRLTGTLVSRRPLPPDATVTVQIENLTRRQWTVRNGQQTFSAANQQSIPFQISYDPTYVFDQDLYEVRAFVSSGGRNIMYTPQAARVLTQGNPKNVQLQLEDVSRVTAYPSGGTTGTYTDYNQIDQEVTRIYQRYVGRQPSAAELAAARILGNDLRSVVESLPLKLMASDEYFDLARHDRDFWLRNVFGVIVGREPTAVEVTQWKQRFTELRDSRTELLRQLYAQSR
ncbi:MAG: YbaY family lipoprotein [Pirellulaceae bacterium]|nr:YbaY family lipoprotein [Pirellulaceae bacterium]